MTLLRHTLPSVVAIISLGALTFTAMASPAIDPVAAKKGLEIAAETVRRNEGWGDSQAAMKMLLTNKHGNTSTREIRIKTLEVEGDGDKSLTIFDKPRDQKGVAFLSFTHSLVPDDQWLYMPALKRVKRIKSSNKSGPFMGSEYAFEDLTSFEVEKYDFEYLRDETLNGQEAFVVRTFPKYEKSGYTKLEVWTDKAEYRILKIDFYDRKNVLLKTLSNTEYTQYLGKYWRAHSASMVNHQNGKRTDLSWSDFKFNTGLEDKDFNRNSLQRAK